ncbi:polysaccharide deacetylase family protein [Sorangium sp. So ce388]|uniref:polysaccharide deacetylase family protein n=1 Tax=Sorangium sp. So ce388 TaxID=3133309 RepID=UPI003F5BAAEA
MSAVEILRTEKGGARRLPTRQEQAVLVCVGACLAAVLLASVLLTGVPPGIAVVSLEFDDTLANQFSARSILAEHRMHATFFVNSGRLDRPGYLTVAELRALASDGHEIGGHTIAHARLPGLPAREQRRQICDDHRALHALGFDVSDFAYPAGAYDSASAEQVRSCGYESSREVGGIGYPPCIFCTWAETIPPRDPMATRTPGSLRRAHSLPRIQALVRRAQRVDGWIQLTFHHICDACDDYSISTEDFSTLLDWLAEEREAGRVAVLTVRQVIRGATPPPRRLTAEWRRPLRCWPGATCGRLHPRGSGRRLLLAPGLPLPEDPRGHHVRDGS